MGREQEMIAYIESQRQAMLDTWRDLVNQDSGSGDKEGLDALRDLLVRRLRDLGGQVRIHAYEMASDLIVADFGKGTEEPIILSGHYDTVFPAGTAA
ncbi:MAG: M20 family peptidase, partial [Veillonella sp.]|nr:M20 family peptidase [Veillonella sp.]